MIDQSAYTGSDYFFDQVGYDPQKPVNVIGDNYFTSELIRREINSSVGGFFRSVMVWKATRWCRP